ncbi:MAG: LytTR family DNA-binding domain-containing protein [Rubrivivax sp.]
MSAPETLRLLIVDDEALARARLRRLVEELAEPAAVVVAEADSAAAAQAVLKQHPGAGAIDAVLLDIGLPGPSGLAFAATLREMAAPPAVVFVTAHAGHALQAFELQALDYLTKPVRRERLAQALERVARWRRGEGAAAVPAGQAPGSAPGAAASGARMLVVSERGRVLRLPHEEISSLRAENKAVVVRTNAQDFIVDESLADLEQRLGDAFVRIHRNALVARHAVRALELRPGLDDEGGGDELGGARRRARGGRRG